MAFSMIIRRHKALFMAGFLALFSFSYISYSIMTDLAPHLTPSKDMVLEVLNLDDHPEALCVDGSPVVFYHDIVGGLAQKPVIIYINGGGRCQSFEQCNKRSV